MNFEGVKDAVMILRDEAPDELVYCLRLRGNTVRPWVFGTSATYTVRLGDPDTNTWQEFTGLKVQP